MSTFFTNVEVALYRDDTWLVIERADTESHAAGMLSFPGGTVEETDGPETPFEHAAVRELGEEVGLHISEPLHYVHSSSFISDAGEKVINIVMVAPAPQGECTLSPEVATVHWLTATEIRNHPKCPPWLLVSIEQVEKERSKLN